MMLQLLFSDINRRFERAYQKYNSICDDKTASDLYDE